MCRALHSYTSEKAQKRFGKFARYEHLLGTITREAIRTNGLPPNPKQSGVPIEHKFPSPTAQSTDRMDLEPQIHNICDPHIQSE